MLSNAVNIISIIYTCPLHGFVKSSFLIILSLVSAFVKTETHSIQTCQKQIRRVGMLYSAPELKNRGQKSIQVEINFF